MTDIWGKEDVQALIAKYGPEFQERFLEVVAELKDQATIDKLEAMVKAGNFDEAILLTEQAALSLAGLWSEVYADSGMESAAALSDVMGVEVNFDAVNQGAVEAMTKTQLRFVREITTNQRDIIHDIVQRGIREGTNPKEMAVEIKQSIGLTQKQLQMVENYRTSLENGSVDALQRKLRDARFDPTVRAAVNGDTVLTTEQIDTMVDRYSERFVAYRSRVIAQTESLRAVHEGSQELYRQAIERGDLEEGEIQRKWLTSHKASVRPSHRAMEGQVRGVNEPFLSGDGNLLMQPGDLNAPPEDTIECHCVLTYRMN